MPIDPKMLMMLFGMLKNSPLLKQGIQAASNNPNMSLNNLTDALLNRQYDPGLLENSSIMSAYSDEPSMGVNLLDQQLGAQFAHPQSGQADLTDMFNRLSPQDPNGPSGDSTYASHLGELLHDTDGSEDEDARASYLEWLKSHGFKR